MRIRPAAVAALAVATALFAIPAAACALTIANPSSEPTANAYGMWYAGSGACAAAGCHEAIASAESVHADMVTDVAADPSKLVPGTSHWPAPNPAGGFTLNATDVYLKIGDRNGLLEYAGFAVNGLTSVVPEGDLPLWDPVGYEQTAAEWEAPSVAVGAKPYAQGCAGCHNLGLTRPSKTNTTLPNGGTQATDTPSAVVQLSIQCEVCHGTGNDPATGAHATGVPAVVGGLQILKAQVCGQCHVTGTTPQRNVSNKAFSSPNGYSTDETLSAAYFTPASTIPSEGGFAAYLASPGTVAKPSFLPNGANYAMRHSYYNEWLQNGAANGYGHVKPMNTSVKGGTDPKCLGCHSGIGFLNRIGAKYATGALIVTDTPSIEFATANDVGITCQVCHKGHVGYKSAGRYDLDREWGNGKPVECADCHNWQFEVLGQALQSETVEGVEGVRPAANTRSRHPQREMLSGGLGADGVNRGLWGVAPTGEYMQGVACKDCHMPRTHKEGMPAGDDGSTVMTRMSHRFHPVLPGDAERWKLRKNGDSCVADCHEGRTGAWTRGQYQTWIDGVQTETEAKAEEATGAIGAIATSLSLASWTRVIAAQPVTGPGAAYSAAEWNMVQKAAQNADMVINDASGGVHQPVYSSAGLDKAVFWATSLRPALTASMVPGYCDGTVGRRIEGTLLGNDGEPIADAVVTLEKSVDGGASWSTVAAAVAGPTFSLSTGPISGPALFRVAFRPDAGVTYTTAAMDDGLPETSIALDPGAAGSMWVSAGAVTATLSSSDAAAVTFYSLSGATVRAPSVYAGPFPVSAEGETVITYWSVNGSGSEAPVAQRVRIDRTGAAASANARALYSDAAAITVDASDSGAGVAYLEYALDGAAWTRSASSSAVLPTIKKLGGHSLRVRASDRMGGIGPVREYAFSVKSTPKLTKSPMGTGYTLRVGNRWRYTAALRRPTGALVVGKRVYLQRSTNGTTWTNYATLATSASGTASRSMLCGKRGTTYWRFHSPGDGLFGAVTGAPTKIVVK